MCSEEFKNRLKEINLKEFAEKYYGVEWKNNKAICCFPNHREKTPSMSYVESSNIIYCHGCKEGGDIYKFVSLMENLDNKKEFVDIMKKICELDGIDFPSYNKPVDQAVVKLLEEKTTFAKEFKENLWSNKGSNAFNYLLNRGLTDKTIATFHLGATKEKNETRYSSHISTKANINLSNRISIPILNRNGDKVIAMSFRDLSGLDNGYKYLHDSTDKVFNKKEVFYGYSHAYPHIKSYKHCYIVEGYFDMISLYQAGIKNTLACMTNQMTEEQINLLSSITKDVTIILDQDAAGAEGFARVFSYMLSKGLNINVVSSIDYLGKDMNDLCNKLDWDSENIKAVINRNSKDAIHYFLSNTLNKYEENLLMLRELAMRSTEIVLNNITDPIKKKNYKLMVNTRLGV